MGLADPKDKVKEDGVQPPDQDLRAPGDPALGGDSVALAARSRLLLSVESEQKGN